MRTRPRIWINWRYFFSVRRQKRLAFYWREASVRDAAAAPASVWSRCILKLIPFTVLFRGRFFLLQHQQDILRLATIVPQPLSPPPLPPLCLRLGYQSVDLNTIVSAFGGRTPRSRLGTFTWAENMDAGRQEGPKCEGRKPDDVRQTEREWKQCKLVQVGGSKPAVRTEWPGGGLSLARY